MGKYFPTYPFLFRFITYICHISSRFTAMIEEQPPKLYSVRGKVDSATEQALKDEQDKLRKLLGRRPTINEVVAMWLTERAKQSVAA